MMNEVFTSEEKQQIKEMEAFLTKAFCLDGECVFIENVVIENSLKKMDGALFALTDSKRGRFYITISRITN